jgi:hypothetical protein
LIFNNGMKLAESNVRRFALPACMTFALKDGLVLPKWVTRYTEVLAVDEEVMPTHAADL